MEPVTRAFDTRPRTSPRSHPPHTERCSPGKVVSERLNRRKVDLIPESEWADPPKARIGELLAAVEARLRARGIESLRDAVEIAEGAATEAGPDPPPLGRSSRGQEGR